ncbi:MULTISPECIES: DMT family transporter [Streptomyces]|uniref:Permease of the drug or metabolite transporter (DMT) superfamily n=1 Tax=Streptomyces venezuelae (strain ATCC 10712 / CBS 650.69 / DSM 40230 / JCM 4526 / NBRC 13096 / PD 04745) TaxID=953739 RepID=F2R8V8_STRVP|nr:DMT family transporter [Streptomyces venezuelae]APE22264.1 EamA family transporter [Streptomyces venezuelae]QER99648.1 DMT family transporter [Streptomyces venezuelae ATCC 10712]QES14590.1 EamA/RhaT family transporter [Streptomyces venezuelae]CCA56418.1 Permease of the drug or metabolite transporter (DMT) superfamily [Streptomyces venezuelae ATCC 10712]
MRNETRGTVELTLAMVLSGTLGVFVVESGASPFEVVFFRCLFGALALGVYSGVRGFFTGHGFTGRKLGLAALGGAFIVFNWVFLFEAYQATSISLATVVYHTQPFFLVLLGALFLRERISAGKLGWLGLAFVGLVLVSGVRPGETASLKGLGFALAAAVLYALATFVTKRITGVRPHLIALVQVLVGLPLLLPFADFGAAAKLGAGWGWLVGLGLIHTGLMYVLMYAAYAKLPTAKIAVLAFTYPAVAMGVDWAVYGHHIGLVQALGVPLIVFASLKVTLAAPARGAAPAPRTGGRAAEAASPVATRVG